MPSRRDFLGTVGVGSMGFAAMAGRARAQQAPGAEILGAEGVKTSAKTAKVWRPISDRKVRVGVIGYGVCQFGAAFGFQDHPNVEIVAVSDLMPDRCAGLAKACRCEKTYPSLEELVKDDSIEAVFIATDAPSHAKHAILALKHGKHVASAVPAVFGSVDEAHELYDAVKSSGLTYMMFETSAFHEDCYAMRQAYKAGTLGKLIYSEGEYYHHSVEQIPSFREWRVGLPPMWYPTHSTAYYIAVTDGTFTEATCLAMPSTLEKFSKGGNRYENPFGSEVALFRTSEGGTSRMAVAWDAYAPGGETGRVYGQRGGMVGLNYQGEVKDLPDLTRPALPKEVATGGHGGSHGFLTDEYISAILEKRKPMVDVAAALNMTVPGVIAHQSALKGGETLKVPQFA
ncbi:MAG: oxidoreductase [Planctomycetales bacterium 71-10]|nr:MAG: oxidoreductase [Planctomycetales bacterium 71-10]